MCLKCLTHLKVGTRGQGYKMDTCTWICHVKNTSTILFLLNLSVYISYEVHYLYLMGTFFLTYIYLACFVSSFCILSMYMGCAPCAFNILIFTDKNKKKNLYLFSFTWVGK